MRDFRGLTKDGKMVYGWYFYEKLNDKHYILVEPSLLADYRFDAIVGHIEVISSSVAQQVGQVDENGKNIYGGDICKVGTYSQGAAEKKIFEVQFSAYKWIFYHKGTGKIITFSETSPMYIEIIGDIHQNPKLLENNNEISKR